MTPTRQIPTPQNQKPAKTSTHRNRDSKLAATVNRENCSNRNLPQTTTGNTPSKLLYPLTKIPQRKIKLVDLAFK